MEQPPDRLLVALTALMPWFDERGLRAAVIGGVGASLRGKPRLTKDIDAVVLDADAETLLATAAQFDFEPRVAGAIDSRGCSKRGGGTDWPHRHALISRCRRDVS